MARKPRGRHIRSIPIMGIDHEVEYTADMDRSDYGECEGVVDKIRININKPSDTFESTLFHEVIHKALELSGQSELMSDRQEEALVVMLERALFRLVQFRPELYQ